MTSKKEGHEFIKIIYFDNGSAQDYLDIENGGHLDWNTEQNQKRAAEILTELEAQVGGGFNILNYIKASITGKANAPLSNGMERIFDSTLESTMLTDFLKESEKDDAIIKIYNDCIIAPENSASMYKMISSYLTIVPKEQMPIDIERLNSAFLDERGYYGLILRSEGKSPTTFLRFNIKCFKNDYNLADLSKMKLSFYGIKVGNCDSSELSIDKEFVLQSNNEKVGSVDQIIGNSTSGQKKVNTMNVIDVILAGVTRD